YPADVKRWKNADRNFEAIGILQCLIKGCRASHRGTDQNMGLRLGADREVLYEKIPHVNKEIVLETAGLGIEKEAAGADIGADTVEAAVGRGHDAGRQATGCDGLVERSDNVVEKAALILRESMQPDHEGILFAGVKTWRQIDVKIPFFAQGL